MSQVTDDLFADDSSALARGEVVLWLLRLDSLSEAIVDQWAAHLSASEVERNDQLALPHIRQRDQACRGLLRELLSGYLGLPAAEVPLTRGEHGKPLLNGIEEGVHFNYSHSGNYAAFAFTLDGEVGVDIEDTGRNPNVLGIARSFFSEREFESLEALPAARQREEFFRYWTLKEAWLKARGEGIFAGLNQFSFDPGSEDGSNGPVAVRLHGDLRGAHEPRYCHSLEPVRGYRVGLAVRGVPGPVAIRQREVNFS